MANVSPADDDTRSWEAAYLRFETPQQEVRKFRRRLRTLGSGRWPKDGAILELFCGRGNGLVALEQLGFTHLVGVDLSPRLIERYTGIGRSVVGDCGALPVRDQSQDVAIVQGGLHHLPVLPADLERVVGEAARVLKPGGLFVVVEPWRTPFLDVVHMLGCSRPARLAWRKLDALAAMIEHEGEIYRRWLREPALIRRILNSRFSTCTYRTGWGKLMFVGRKR